MRVWAANVICAKDRDPRRWARRTGASILILALAAAAGTGCSAPSSGPPQAESPVGVDPDRAETDPPRAEPSVLVDPDRDGADEPRAESSVRVIADRHEVDYPRAIVLRLDLESDEEIAEVTLFYHLAGKPSRVYGYPQVMVGRSVSTEFSIKTGGANYLPAGVEIEYYYRIRDSRGGVLETPHVKVTYLDPAYRWRELREGDLVVTWHDLSEERVRKVVTDAEARLRVAKEMFGLDDVRPVKAVIFNSRKESERGLPFVSEAASQRHLYGGFAFQAYDQFVLSGLSEHGITRGDAPVAGPGRVVAAGEDPGVVERGSGHLLRGERLRTRPHRGRGRTRPQAVAPAVDGSSARTARRRCGVLRAGLEHRDAHDRDSRCRAHGRPARRAGLRP